VIFGSAVGPAGSAVGPAGSAVGPAGSAVGPAGGSAVDPVGAADLSPGEGLARDVASGFAVDAAGAAAVRLGAVGGGSAGAGYASRPGLREQVAGIARDAGMAVCGAGCMGFVNVARGLRAIGYAEPDPLPEGPVALVTHSGSVFSALLRTRRAFGFTLAVSSGQELVTPAAAYARYALTLPQTKVLALVLEAIRDATSLRAVLADAAARDLPVLLLAAGACAASQPLVAAHSGALAAGDGAWEALASAYGVHRVSDLAELADSLELFSLARRPKSRGIATVHDSGFERAHVADVAAAVGVPFAPIGDATRQRLAAVLDPGLEPGNPLDVWGTGRDAEGLFTEALSALADDPAVGAVALAVDLVHEYDGDDSYRAALLAAAAKTDKPLAVLASIPAAIDQGAAASLRAAGIPVLESTRSGLLALRHLLARGKAATPSDGCGGGEQPVVDPVRQPPGRARRVAGPVAGRVRRDRWAARLAAGPLGGAELLALLRDYGIPAVRARSAGDLASALAAAEAIGYPVAVKTDRPDTPHKSDVGGVRLGIATPAALAAVYQELAASLGPRVTVTEMAAAGPELILGLARDPALGPLVIVGAGGVLTEFLAERSVALPPLTRQAAAEMIVGLRYSAALSGVRGQPPCDLGALVSALVCFSTLVTELGEHLAAFDLNPLICSPSGVLAVDALAVPIGLPRRPRSAGGPARPGHPAKAVIPRPRTRTGASRAGPRTTPGLRWTRPAWSGRRLRRGPAAQGTGAGTGPLRRAARRSARRPGTSIPATGVPPGRAADRIRSAA
jgi:acetate---CoA ligase (ADP-forming)